MKFTKLSLVAALAVSSAFAGGDIAPVEAAPVVEAVSPWTFGGDAKLYYSTTTGQTDLATGQTVSIWDQYASTGQGAVSADIGYAINSNWKVNLGLTGLVTLGLDDSVVSGVWLPSTATPRGLRPVPPLGQGTSIGDALWVDTFNITGTMFDGALTTVIGRQELDTPLAFSEQWNIAPNTFDAAVALYKATENITLVGAYIHDGNGNANRIGTFDKQAGGFSPDNGYTNVPGADNGAWTVAGIATFGDVTAQVWYYDIIDVADAVWAQVDGNFAGFQLGAQYAWIGPKDLLGAANDSSGFAVKAGYKLDALDIFAAYSSVDNDSVLPLGNTATLGNGMWGNPTPTTFGWSYNGIGQSKLYTEAWWNYGLVALGGSDTITVAADYNFGDVSILRNVNIHTQYTGIKNDVLNFELDEYTAVVGADVVGLNVQVAYIGTNGSDTSTTPSQDDNTDTVQLYLTYKF